MTLNVFARLISSFTLSPDCNLRMFVEGANYLVPVAFGATGAITVVTGETVKTQAWAASAEK